MPGRDPARGRALEVRRSICDVAGMLSRWEENVFDSDEGRSENLRDGLPSPEWLVFLREKPNDVRRLESVLCRGADTASFDIGPGIEVGG